jgi:benzodiazapine receptor
MRIYDTRRRDDRAGVAAVVAATLATAVGGSLSGDFGSDWYQRLRKPAWQPSGAVIGAIWTVLYTMTALAASDVWRRRERLRGRTFWLVLALQYLFNAAFTPLFTRRHALRLATLDAALLSVSVGTLLVLAWPVRRLAAMLLLPSVLWTSFATWLSLRLWQLNR